MMIMRYIVLQVIQLLRKEDLYGIAPIRVFHDGQ